MPGEPHSKRRKLDTDVVPKAGQHGEWQPSGTPLNGTESSTESTSSSEYSVSTNLPHNAPSTTGIGTTQNRALASAAMYSTAGNTSMASPPYRQGLHINRSSSSGTPSQPGTIISRPFRPRTSSSETLPPVHRGDIIALEGYRDVRVIGVHYDDMIACRAYSLARGDLKVFLKLSLTARPTAAAQFKAEASLLHHLRDKGVHNVTKVIGREHTALGSMMIVHDEELKTFSEMFLTKDRPAPPCWNDTSQLLNALEHSVKLVRIVAQIHEAQVVHGSLRPSIISVSPLFNEVHVHDFSCAFRTGPGGDSVPIRERGMKEEESLRYIAPECTGRVGKVPDGRSDFYAIGATLFELFTGRLLFADAEDPLDVIHAHIVRRPPSMIQLDSSIPIELAQIVAKLLEKNPDLRYQTAQGLIIDLEKVLELVRRRRTGSTMTAGAGADDSDSVTSDSVASTKANPAASPQIGNVGHDIGSGSHFVVGSIDEAAYFRLPPPDKMFGRDKNVQSLLACHEHVKATNTTQVIVVKGPSGIGKTSFVERLKAPAVKDKGYFAVVKFDQIKSPVPFFAISQALSSLFRQILAEPEAKLAIWRRRIAKALGKEGRVLTDVLATLENVFGSGWIDTLPPLVPLGAQESEERFQSVVQSVMRCFARYNKPLVLVFDDLQWSTAADINFVLRLTKEAAAGPELSSHPMLLVCLYRDNEVGSEHVVNTLLHASLPELALDLKLEPLGLSDVIAFVGETLRQPGNGTQPSQSALSTSSRKRETRHDTAIRMLSEVILARTKGSPLFVAQLLKALNAEGMFKFDFATASWLFDLELIASNSISTDVVELLLAQIRKFSPQTRYALMIAACLGNEELSPTVIAQAAGKTPAEIAADLQQAVDDGILVGGPDADERRAMEEGSIIDAGSRRHSTASNAFSADPNGVRVPEAYRFFHDRSQQAAYALLPVEDRHQVHYRIGQRLVEAVSLEELNERIFDIVNQLNYGIDILQTMSERDVLAKYNYLAASKSIKATAFEPTRRYLQTAWDLLGPGGWVGQHELMSKVTEALIEVEYSLTDYQASQKYVRIFLEHSTDKIAKLRVFARSIRSATATGDSTQAIEIGRRGLASVGVHFPDDTAEANALASSIRAELALTTSAINGLIDLPRMTDPISSGAQQILAALIPPIYFTRIDLLGVMTAISARTTVKQGLDDAGALMLTLLAVIVAGQHGELEQSLAYGRTAIKYFEKYGGSPLACPAYKIYSSHVAPWVMSIRETFPSFRTSISYGLEYRDAEYVGFGCGELCSYSMLAGVPLPEVASNLERFTVLVRKFRHELSTLYIAVIQQAAWCWTGRSADPGELEGEAFTAADYATAAEKQYGVILFMYQMLRLIGAVFFEDKDRAKQSAAIGRQHIAGGQGLLYTVFFQLFEALSMYDRFEELTDADKHTLADTVTEIHRLSLTNRENFYPFKLWLDAEAARVAGQSDDALKLYDDAIASATRSEYVHLAACMNERCAAMLKTPKLAAGYIIEARELWRQWGCGPKLAALSAQHPGLFPPPVPPLNRFTSNTDSNTSEGSDSMGRVPMPDDLEAPHIPRDEVEQSTAWTNGRIAKVRRASTSSVSTLSQSNGGENERASEHWSMTEHSEGVGRSQLATELDLRTVVSASSVIASEVSIDGVVSKLLSLAMRTAGAEMCLLVLDKGGMLCAEAVASSDSNDTQHLRRTDAIDAQPERYPCSVINYVARSKMMVVNSLDVLGDNFSDPYLAKHHPRSILCLALANHQRLIGVLYMENSQTNEAFTPDRLEIVSLISAQAAATIEKARLVHDLKASNADLKRSQAALEGYNRGLEGTVADRTLELQHKNQMLMAEVAEKERAQAEMRSAKDIAEAATLMKSQFLANMSHEIRTPFNAVVALTGLLLDTSLTPVQTDYVETIKNSSQELLVVINDILDYSKIELDHLELSQDSVQLRSVLESSMDMLAERAASKSVELTLVMEQVDISIIGDLTRLRQIVVNLLSNAVKFTQEGEIVVTAFSEPVEKTTKGEGMSRVTISVQDTGIGIAKENLPKLFRVFSQAEGVATSQQFGGTGLGLAISRNLSTLMGGDITLKSEPGKGSTFTLQLVARNAEPPELDLYSPAQNSDLVGKRCLIVDANATSRKTLQQLLKSFGLQADAPEEPTEAYRVASDAHEASKPYHVLIIDAFLPDFAAQVLLRRLRQNGINTPAIALTRMGSPIYEEMRQLDCRFLIKPVKRNRLHYTLRQVFPVSETRKITPAPRTGKDSFPANFATDNPLSILCAEDNPINVKVITHLLKRIGYTTDIAEDGLIALEKVRKKKYDIIFMDVNMPRMNGLEATREIVKMIPDPLQRPWIVCLTANAMSGDRESCMAAGGDGYVSKPVLVPALLEALSQASFKVLRARRMTDTPAAPTPPPFELELPTSRLGRASRSRRQSGAVGGRSSSHGSAGSSPSPSPDPEATVLATVPAATAVSAVTAAARVASPATAPPLVPQSAQDSSN